MKHIPKITIGILNYNGRHYLEQCIPPLLSQLYKNKEIVVVDNGSTDGSQLYLQQFSEIIVVQNKENMGYSKGKNQIVQHASGKYILMIDNDIFLPQKNYIEGIFDYYSDISRKKSIAFLAPLFYDKGNGVTKYYGIFYSFYGINVHKKKLPLSFFQRQKQEMQIGSFHGGAVFFQKSIWGDLGGYDESQMFMLDDLDIGARSHIYGYKNFLYPCSPLVHLGKAHDENKKHFAWKFRYYFLGISTMMFKNYTWANFIKTYVIFLFFSFFLSGALLIIKRNPHMIFSPFVGHFLFWFRIKKILSERRKIQAKRKEKEDTFLRISPNICKN